MSNHMPTKHATATLVQLHPRSWYSQPKPPHKLGLTRTRHCLLASMSYAALQCIPWPMFNHGTNPRSPFVPKRASGDAGSFCVSRLPQSPPAHQIAPAAKCRAMRAAPIATDRRSLEVSYRPLILPLQSPYRLVWTIPFHDAHHRKYIRTHYTHTQHTP